jgi:hypothetical protein
MFKVSQSEVLLTHRPQQFGHVHPGLTWCKSRIKVVKWNPILVDIARCARMACGFASSSAPRALGLTRWIHQCRTLKFYEISTCARWTCNTEFIDNTIQYHISIYSPSCFEPAELHLATEVAATLSIETARCHGIGLAASGFKEA